MITHPIKSGRSSLNSFERELNQFKQKATGLVSNP